MKKLVLTMALLAGATMGYAQGTINWTDYVSPSGSGAGFSVTIFGPATPTSPAQNLGNTSADLPAGTATYAGAPLSGSAFEVGLYVGTSEGAAQNAVVSGSPIATSSFLTGGSAGTWFLSSLLTATDNGDAPGTKVFVALAAWSTAGGASSYAAATERGFSTSSVTLTEGGGSPPVTPPSLQGTGITDFAIGSVPEPSTIALGVMGASAFLMRLRRK